MRYALRIYRSPSNAWCANCLKPNTSIQVKLPLWEGRDGHVISWSLNRSVELSSNFHFQVSVVQFSILPHLEYCSLLLLGVGKVQAYKIEDVNHYIFYLAVTWPEIPWDFKAKVGTAEKTNIFAKWQLTNTIHKFQTIYYKVLKGNHYRVKIASWNREALLSEVSKFLS